MVLATQQQVHMGRHLRHRRSRRHHFLGRLQYLHGVHQHATVLHLLPRDGRKRLPGIQDNHSLQEPHRRAGHLCRLPCPQGGGVPKLVRKIRASNELLHKVLGSINTKEKFEAKRLTLAENVWAEMECERLPWSGRNCHSFDAMDFKKQESRPRKEAPQSEKAR